MAKETRTAATDKGKKQLPSSKAGASKGNSETNPSGYKLSGYKDSGRMNKVKK
jgi:hypothetical protein